MKKYQTNEIDNIFFIEEVKDDKWKSDIEIFLLGVFTTLAFIIATYEAILWIN